MSSEAGASNSFLPVGSASFLHRTQLNACFARRRVAIPTTVQTPVVAIFEQRGQAIGAIDELEHAGFTLEQIGIATPGQPVREANTPVHRREAKAAEGAATGAIAGGMAGAVSGALAAASIPGVGPVLAGGFLARHLGGHDA